MNKTKILFVWMGNICRSPTAEGVFAALLARNHLSDQFKIDSAGTHAYHTGDAPDLRAQKAARNRGIELKNIRARVVVLRDFDEFDHILVMDEENFLHIEGICPVEHQHKVGYLLDYAPHLDTREVPDPYYGGSYGFDRVLDMAEEAAEGLLQAIQQAKLAR